MPVTKNRQKPFRVVNRKSGAEIYILDEINSWSENSAAEFKRKIDVIGENESVKLYINSPGGAVDQALAIYNMIQPIADRMEAHIIGMAISAASWIAMSAKKVCMRKNSLMMIHNPTTFGLGDEYDLEATLNMLKKVRDVIVNVYSSKSGKDPEEIKAMLDAETWMTADEALENGFIDEVLDEEPELGLYEVENLQLPGRVWNSVSAWKKPGAANKKIETAKPEEKTMKNLLKILVENKLINSVDVDESEAVVALTNYFKQARDRETENADLKNRLESKDTELQGLAQAAADTAVNAYVQVGAIPENEKEFWTEAYLNNRANTVKILDARKGQAIGGAPLNLGHEGGNSPHGGQTELDRLRNEYEKETDRWKRGEISRKIQKLEKEQK